MDMNLIAGRIFSQQTSGEKLENGDWKVSVTITEKVKESSESEWLEANIDSEAQDKNFDNAHKLAMFSALQELNRLVYSRGLESMFEGLLVDEKEKENGSSNNRPDTPTQ